MIRCPMAIKTFDMVRDPRRTTGQTRSWFRLVTFTNSLGYLLEESKSSEATGLTFIGTEFTNTTLVD